VAGLVLNQELRGGVRSIPVYMDHFDGLCPKEHCKGNVRTRNQMGKYNSLGLSLY